MDQRIAKPAPSSIGSISDGRAEKQREVYVDLMPFLSHVNHLHI